MALREDWLTLPRSTDEVTYDPPWLTEGWNIFYYSEVFGHATLRGWMIREEVREGLQSLFSAWDIRGKFSLRETGYWEFLDLVRIFSRFWIGHNPPLILSLL